jgi:hypothetical protein
MGVTDIILIHTVILSFARLGIFGKSALYLGELYERIKELTGVPLAGQKIIGKITARIENQSKT